MYVVCKTKTVSVATQHSLDHKLRVNIQNARRRKCPENSEVFSSISKEFVRNQLSFLGSGPVGDDDLWYHLIPGTLYSSVPPTGDLLPGSEALPACFGALPAGSEGLPAGFEALPAGSKAHPA